MTRGAVELGDFNHHGSNREEMHSLYRRLHASCPLATVTISPGSICMPAGQNISERIIQVRDPVSASHRLVTDYSARGW
jgi:hypothetical protein